MKYEDIFAAISHRYDTFTRMEQNIADYVLEHGKDVLDMSISTLARECKVVDSTVFRFCLTLGVSGYRDFRTALAVSLCAREQKSDPPIADDDPAAVQVRHIYDSCLNALRETYQLLNPSLLDEAVRRLMLADRILVLGAGKSMVSTFGAYRQLMLAMPKVQCALNAHEQRKLCAMVTARDAVILFVQSDAPAFSDGFGQAGTQQGMLPDFDFTSGKNVVERSGGHHAALRWIRRGGHSCKRAGLFD